MVEKMVVVKVVFRSSWNPHTYVFFVSRHRLKEFINKIKEMYEEIYDDVERYVYYENDNKNKIVIETSDAGLAGLPPIIIDLAYETLGEPADIVDLSDR